MSDSFYEQLFDSHAHLQDERFQTGLPAVIDRSRNARITQILCCGTRETDWRTVLSLAHQFPEMIPAIGMHPWFISERSTGWAEEMRNLLQANFCCQIGEIGLDHASLGHQNEADQELIFRKQLEISRDLQRAVSIHCRKAWKLLIEVLQESNGLHCGGAIHSFGGSAELVPPLVELGCYFSFSGAICNPANKRARRALLAVPLHRLLIETDSPDIVPYDAPGNLNEPANLVLVISVISKILGISESEVAAITFENAQRLFCGHN